MFLVYIDDFMSSNPSWHQPNPLMAPTPGTNNKGRPLIFMASTTPHGSNPPSGTTPTPGTNNNKGCHPVFMVPTTRGATFSWYWYQPHGAHPISGANPRGATPMVMVPTTTTTTRGATPSA